MAAPRDPARSRRLCLLLAASLGLLGLACGGGSGGGGNVQFQNFVLGLIGSTADNTDPVDLNQLSYSISEDPNQFNSLF